MDQLWMERSKRRPRMRYARNKNGREQVLNVKKMFHNQLRPVITLARIVGHFPIHVNDEGYAFFKYVSLLMCYSLLLYVLVVAASFHSLWRRAQQTGNSFDERLTFSEIAVFMLPYILSPVIQWRESNKMADYISKWVPFQKLFLRTTGNQLDIQSYQRNKYFLMMQFALTVPQALVPLLVFHVSLEEDLVWVMNYLVLSLVISSWNSNCYALTKAGQQLVHYFKDEIQRGQISQKLLFRYKILWIHLSQMTQQLGNTVVYTFGSFALIMFTQVVLTLYFSQSILWTVPDASVGMQIACSIFFLFGLFMMCQFAYSVRQQVTDGILLELHKLQSSKLSETVWMEVNSFMDAIAMNPSTMNLGGYTYVDRSLFVSFISTALTYLIVLLQLRMGYGIATPQL